MRKLYTPSLTAKSFLFIGFLVLSNILRAQVDIGIGNSTVGNTGTVYPSPLQDWYEGSRAQYLYTAAELTAAGMAPGNITALKFNVTNLNSFSGNIEQYSIKIGSTTTASLSTSSTVWETTTDVYGPVDYVPTLGVNTFTFSTPFFWNGTDNIVVEVCNGLPANITDGLIHYTQNVTVPWTTGLSFNGSHTIANDNSGNLCGSTIAGAAITTTATNRPDIVFSWIPGASCSGTPAGGTAQSSVASVCSPTTPFTLSVTGATAATGLSYQWQSSPNNSAWTDISGASTFAYTSPGIAAPTYFRRRITCGTNSSFSASVQVTVNNPTYAPVPYTESFEGTWIDVCATRDVPNNSWRNNPSTGVNSWRRYDDGVLATAWANLFGAYTPVASNGSFSARFHTYEAGSGTGIFELYLNCATPNVGKRLSFDYINTSGNDSLVIYVSTNGGATFTRLDSVRTAAAWTTKTITFGSNSATTIVRFQAYGDVTFGTDIGLDNVSVSDLASCTGTPTGGTGRLHRDGRLPGHSVYTFGYRFHQSYHGLRRCHTMAKLTGQRYLDQHHRRNGRDLCLFRRIGHDLLPPPDYLRGHIGKFFFLGRNHYRFYACLRTHAFYREL